jgi:hypothetical protein
MTTLKIEYWCAACDSEIWKTQTTPIKARRKCECCGEDALQINFIEEIDKHETK